MSDEKKQVQDEELDKVSGGIGTHPIPIDPIRPGQPPTRPGQPQPTPPGGHGTHPGG
jgi:hypothetical protein